MAWVTDLASVLGIPAGAATLALAMYGACSAAEKVARPEALRDIGGILKNPSWSNAVRPSSLIAQVFVWTFGERHLSWKCARRSIVASATFTTMALCVFIAHKSWTRGNMWNSVQQDPFLFTAEVLFAGIVPDYLALWKSRFLIQITTTKNNGVGGLSMLILADLVGSAVISLAFLYSFLRIVGLYYEYIRPDIMGGLFEDITVIGFAVIPMISTLLSSLWITLIFLSTATLGILAPMQRFTAWFFDADKHPVTSIGIVAGALVMVGSGIWTAIRAMI